MLSLNVWFDNLQITHHDFPNPESRKAFTTATLSSEESESTVTVFLAYGQRLVVLDCANV